MIDPFLITYVASVTFTTDASGLATAQVSVPGTFNGFNGYTDPLSSGRYLSGVDIWMDTYVTGDRVSGIYLKDLDGVIPPPYKAIFPNYPILETFHDSDLVETQTVFKGAFLNPNNVTTISAPFKNKPAFAPSGLYVIGEFTGGSTVPNRIGRANFYWAKQINVS